MELIKIKVVAVCVLNVGFTKGWRVCLRKVWLLRNRMSWLHHHGVNLSIPTDHTALLLVVHFPTICSCSQAHIIFGVGHLVVDRLNTVDVILGDRPRYDAKAEPQQKHQGATDEKNGTDYFELCTPSLQTNID